VIDKLLELSKQELKDPQFELTKQYLEVLQLEWENGNPKIESIETDEDGTLLLHFYVKDEGFFYTHFFDMHPTLKLRFMGTTPASMAYLNLTSTSLSLAQILAQTTLKPTTTQEMGQPIFPAHKNSARYTYNGFHIEPNTPLSHNFEKKLLSLLNLLEPHKAELNALEKNCSLKIQAFWKAHCGNTILGGFFLDKAIIKKLAELNLEIDFDLYAGGEFLS
jgi:hypothetical protein